MNLIKEIVFLYVLVLVTHFSSCSDDFPSTIERCKYDDGECLKKLWTKYIKLTVPNGLQEFGIPNLYNYFVPKATISPGKGPLDIVLKMRDSNFTGLDTLVFDKVSGFTKEPKDMKKFELIAHCPLLEVKGKYNVTGKILLLPVAGDDVGRVKFNNVKLNITALTSTKVIDGKEYLTISKVYCDYTSERNDYQFENLLNNKVISDSINKIINENQDIINNENRGPIGKVLAHHFKTFLVAAFKKYPYKSLFLEA